MNIKKISPLSAIACGLGMVACAFETSAPTVERVATESGASSKSSLAPDQCGAWRPALIDDLEDGDVFFGASGTWVVFNDETGSQVPVILDDLAVRGGPKGSRYAAHSSGAGFTNWGAGFGVALGCGYDVRKYDGLRFKVKGEGQAFSAQLLTLGLLPDEFGGRCTGDDCNDFYQARVTLPADGGWYECTVPFSHLAQGGWGKQEPLDLQSVTGVQFNFGLEDVPYDLWVDDLEFSQRSKLVCTPVRSSCK